MKPLMQILKVTITFFIGMLFVSNSAISQSMELVSVKTNKSITLDANLERAWNKAEALEVELSELPYKPNNGYEGMKATTVTIRSLHDAENIYFYVQYDDPTKSLERFPWVKQENGSWKQLSNKDSTGHDNTYYEDKLGMYWDINARGFKKKGCAVSCHLTEDGLNNGIKDKSAGRKYTKPGQNIDMWHWKGVRTNPVGMFDDQYVNSNTDPKKNKNWGRAGDDKTGGGYKNNVNKDKSGPAFMNSDNSEYKYMVVPWLKTKFVDTFKAGDVIPGIMVTPFTGPRADIKVKGVWKNGVWNLEFSRKLETSGKQTKVQDVQFSDKSKSYYFGMSVFDNSQINHIYHDGSIKLTFE